MHLHKVEIRFINRILRKFWLNVQWVFLSVMTLCSCRHMVWCGVTLPYLPCAKSMLPSPGFWHLLCRCTVAESTENILVTTKLRQGILNVLDHGFSVVLVLCHEVKIHKSIDNQMGISGGNALARWRVWNRRCKNWSNHASGCFQLLTTPLGHFATWLIESSQARIWRHHRAELVKFFDHGMLLETGHHPVYQMLSHTKTYGMKNIGYNNHRRRDTFHIPDDLVWGSGGLIFQILSFFSSLHPISLSRDYHLLEV